LTRILNTNKGKQA